MFVLFDVPAPGLHACSTIRYAHAWRDRMRGKSGDSYGAYLAEGDCRRRAALYRVRRRTRWILLPKMKEVVRRYH